MALSAFTVLCSRHHYSFPQLFHHPKLKLHLLNNNSTPLAVSPAPSKTFRRGNRGRGSCGFLFTKWAGALKPVSGFPWPLFPHPHYPAPRLELPERLLLIHANTPGFLAPGGEEFNPGPETRLDRSELLCNKVLLKYKGDRESFWHRHQKGAEREPPC